MRKTHSLLFLLMMTFCFKSLSQNKLTNLPTKGLCAHRGAMDTHPENTLPAFKEAIRLGAHMIEFDIQLTKNGELIIMHDGKVDRTTNGTGSVAELSFSEIRKLDAGNKKSESFKGTLVPTFKETLDMMPDNIWLNCHLKGGAAVGEAAAKLLQKSGKLNQAFLACGEEAAVAARKAVPSIQICNSENKYRTKTDLYVKATIDMKADFIQLVSTAGQEDRTSAIALLKKHGIRVSYYYAKKAEELPALFNSGIDFILVNNLSEMMPVALKLGIEPLKN